MGFATCSPAVQEERWGNGLRQSACENGGGEITKCYNALWVPFSSVVSLGVKLLRDNGQRPLYLPQILKEIKRSGRRRYYTRARSEVNKKMCDFQGSFWSSAGNHAASTQFG